MYSSTIYGCGISMVVISYHCHSKLRNIESCCGAQKNPAPPVWSSDWGLSLLGRMIRILYKPCNKVHYKDGRFLMRITRSKLNRAAYGGQRAQEDQRY